MTGQKRSTKGRNDKPNICHNRSLLKARPLPAAMDLVSRKLTGRNPTASEQFAESCCPKLSYQQRLYGFIACFSLGWIMSALGSITLFTNKSASRFGQFGIIYGFGQLIALCATFFLSGPAKACKTVFHKKRVHAASFYIGMIVVVISMGLAKLSPGLIITALCIQLCAAIWYAASYFPFGRTIIKSCLKKPFK